MLESLNPVIFGGFTPTFRHISLPSSSNGFSPVSHRTLSPMSTFLRKSIARSVRSSDLGFVRRLFSVSSSDEDRSFVVSYLINSLGFSPKAASSASERVKFDSPEKPDKTLEFFKGHGFTHAQISSLARRYPNVLTRNVERSISPKFEFLASKGISIPVLAKRLSVYPSMFRLSLDKQIKPTFDFFQAFFPSNKMTIEAVRRFPDILKFDIEKYVKPNVSALRDHGVPDSKIATLLYNWPTIIETNPVVFGEIVNEVVKTGFDPSTKTFVLAVYAIHLKRTGSKWESKLDMYKKWGWSEEEVLRAFRKDPWCMMISEDKITACMEFFITEMGLKPCELAEVPHLFAYSLEKRVIPRVSIYRVLRSRGLLKKEICLSTLVNISETDLLRKLVTPYAKEAPDLLKLYREKIAATREV